MALTAPINLTTPFIAATSVTVAWGLGVADELGADVVGGGTYSGATKTVTVQAGRVYLYTGGATETSFVNGDDTTASSEGLQVYFQAQGTSVVLNGVNTQAVTATIKPAQVNDCLIYRNDVHVATSAGPLEISLSINQTGLSQLTAYSWKVRNTNRGGEMSALSAMVGAVTPSSTNNPGFPVTISGATSDNNINAVAVDGSGNIYASGFFLINGTDALFFIIKIDTNGNITLAKCYSVVITAYAVIAAIGIDGAGDILMAGWYSGSVDFGHGPMVSVGEAANCFLIKVSSSGVLNRAIPIDFGGYDNQLHSLATDSSSNIIIGGVVFDRAGFGPIIRKYNSSFAEQWTKAFTHGSDTSNIKVGVDSSDNIMVTGAFSFSVNPGLGTMTKTGAFGTDVFLCKLSGTDGSCIWQKQLGGSLADTVSALAVDSGNNVIIAGLIFDLVDFGGGNIGSSGQFTGYVAKFNNSGTYVWAKSFGLSGIVAAQIKVLGLAIGDSDAVFVSGLSRRAIDFASATHDPTPGTDFGYVAKYTSAGAESSFTTGGTALYAVDTGPSSKLIAAGQSGAQVYIQRVNQ